MTNTLYVKAYGQYLYDGENSRMAAYIYFSAPDFYQQPTLSPLPIEFAVADNPSATPYPQFISIQTAIAYYSATQAAALVSQINTAIGLTYYTASDVEVVDSAVLADFNALATVAHSGAYTDLSGKPSLATVATSGSYLDLSNTPTINTPSFSNPTRSLNSAFQISSTRNTQVSYSVDISCTMSLTSGQSGLVVLEYADDSGITTNVKTVARSASANNGSLTIGLNLTNLSTATVNGMIPAGKYARLRTVNTTGTPTFTLQNAQEVLI